MHLNALLHDPFFHLISSSYEVVSVVRERRWGVSAHCDKVLRQSVPTSTCWQVVKSSVDVEDVCRRS
jgi:hypothetical protein